jgi:hypothetical protein
MFNLDIYFIRTLLQIVWQKPRQVEYYLFLKKIYEFRIQRNSITFI